MWRAVLIVVVLAASTASAQIAIDDAAKLLYDGKAPDACAKNSDPIACMLSDRYGKDPKAATLALALYRATGDIAGLGDDEMMDGGFRGTIHLVPQLPTGAYRQHLAWVTAAMTEIEKFFAAQFADQAPKYRWRDLAFKFVRSVKKHTPSAYATSWSIEYNVEGSLLRSERGVRETIFHELFHLNDEDHGDWSAKTLGADYDAIVAKCERAKGVQQKVDCYQPYAPNDTKVIATGAYYAFQQNNGTPVHEYAAELTVRYYKEQTEMRAHEKLSHKAFKCGPPENGRSWKSLVDEFFAGRDLVPGC
jgi:hypothetical protein